MRTSCLTASKVRQGQMLHIHGPFSPLKQSPRLRRACVTSWQCIQRQLLFQGTHGSSVLVFMSCVSSICESMATAAWMVHSGQPPLQLLSLKPQISKHTWLVYFTLPTCETTCNLMEGSWKQQLSTICAAFCHLSGDCPLTYILQYPEVHITVLWLSDYTQLKKCAALCMSALVCTCIHECMIFSFSFILSSFDQTLLDW